MKDKTVKKISLQQLSLLLIFWIIAILINLLNFEFLVSVFIGTIDLLIVITFLYIKNYRL